MIGPNLSEWAIKRRSLIVYFMIAAIVAGQMMASLVLDARGWVGFAQQPLTPARLLGGLLVIAGVLLINRR